MLSEVRTGFVVSGDSGVNILRAGRYGELLLNEAVGNYYELSKQGRIFTASIQAVTNLGTALTATAVTITLANPSGSGHHLSVISGALVATDAAAASSRGAVWAANTDPSVAINVTNTAITVQPALIGSGFTSIGRAFSATTLPAAPVIVRVFPYRYVQVITTSTAVGGLAAVDYVHGAICLTPNTSVTLQGIAGTNLTGMASITWCEIPI